MASLRGCLSWALNNEEMLTRHTRTFLIEEQKSTSSKVWDSLDYQEHHRKFWECKWLLGMKWRLKNIKQTLMEHQYMPVLLVFRVKKV